MIFDPDTIDIPKSYETLSLTDVKVSHHPAGAPEATPVIVVTLNRPQKHNSFTLEMMHVFEKIYPMFDVDERVKVVVLTGAGKMFCAGADLERGFSSGGRLALAIHRCRKPTIAVMQGSAVGLGMAMTLPAAIRIGCQKSKYGFVISTTGSDNGIKLFVLPPSVDWLLECSLFAHDCRHFPAYCTTFRDVVPGDISGCGAGSYACVGAGYRSRGEC
jgi:hypothetical protein